MKKLILTTLGMIFAASSLANGLTLINSTSSSIAVSCNGINGVTLTPGMTFSPPWSALQFMFHSTAFSCSFADGVTQPSTAYVNISGNTGMLSQIQAHGVTLDFGTYNPNSPQYTPNITVKIS